MAQIVHVINWYAGGKQSSTPHLIKQKIVKDYKEKYKVQILVETGTYLGTMVNATKNDFKKIYSIELDKKLYNHARNKFKNYAHIKIMPGDSAKVLPQLLKQIRRPTLFWLDAHFSKGITAKGNKETPIMEELNSIFKHKIKTHIILIDDAQVFSGKNGYPSEKFLKKYVTKKKKNLLYTVKNNIVRITPH